MYLCAPRSLCTLGSTNHCQRLATTFNMPVGCSVWEGAPEMNENMPLMLKTWVLCLYVKPFFAFQILWDGVCVCLAIIQHVLSCTIQVILHNIVVYKGSIDNSMK